MREITWQLIQITTSPFHKRSLNLNRQLIGMATSNQDTLMMAILDIIKLEEVVEELPDQIISKVEGRDKRSIRKRITMKVSREMRHKKPAKLLEREAEVEALITDSTQTTISLRCMGATKVPIIITTQ